jgi:D-alanyl-D-alanine carboxypeptidase
VKRFLALAVALGLVVAPVAPVRASQANAALRVALQRDLDQYLATRSKIEHLSAITLSVSLHGAAQNINLVTGRTEYGGGVPITSGSVWQIGSNTKAFTAATILQLEAEGKLTIDQTVGRWLPQYPAWKHVTIRRLLSMTSGIPTYDDTTAMLSDYAKNPKRNFTIHELIAYVYPSNPKAPKATTGYSYSNTNYLLAELIIEHASHDGYSNELDRRYLRSGLGLSDTYYAATQYPQEVLTRIPAAYFVNHDPGNEPLSPLLGRNVRDDSVSWMQGAGGVASTAEDLTRWARALYTGPMLPPKQRAELLSLISTKTGKPIATTSLADPRGFGLGVAQMTLPDLGTIWFYEGESLGFRMVQFYLPNQDVVVAFGFNSRPDGSLDQAGKLATAIYHTLIVSSPLITK